MNREIDTAEASGEAAPAAVRGETLRGLRVWSVGHSTFSLAEFATMLSEHGVEQIADVRRFPGSRRHPHFREPELRDGLAHHGIGYAWLPALGGRRAARNPDWTDSGWRHPAFRAYAAHLKSDEFAGGLQALIDLAREQLTAMMCSEVLWWRCHRRLISDVLVAAGAEVLHIFSAGKSEPHTLRPPARIVGGRLAYPAAEE